MLKNVLSNFKKKRPDPEYEPPIQKRIVHLQVLRCSADELIRRCKELVTVWDKGDAPLLNSAEGLSTCLKMLADSMAPLDREYANFLAILSKRQLEEKVIGPLTSWILTDFTRIDGQIEQLHARKHGYDDAMEVLAKKGQKLEVQLRAAQCRLEYERQMDVVKSELAKLTPMKNDHAVIFSNFLRLYSEYQARVCAIIEEAGADKWVSQNVQCKQKLNQNNCKEFQCIVL